MPNNIKILKYYIKEELIKIYYIFKSYSNSIKKTYQKGFFRKHGLF